jgi:signal-transduction protein with cAMP-binding, CBS, and nucleotidyltransferase domain
MQSVGELLVKKGSGVVSISPDASVDDAVRLMSDRGIGSLLVTHEGDICGIVTERDYTRKVVVEGRSVTQTRVFDIMTREVVTADPQDNIDECMLLMTNRRIRHLPILEDGNIVGLISIGDLMHAIVSDHAREIDALDNPQ